VVISGVPSYRVIADELIARIRSGDLPPGAQMPSLTELTEKYSEGPVRRAMQVIKAEGWAVSVVGSGTYVADPLPVRPAPEDPVRRESADQTRVVGAWRGWHQAVRRAGGEPWSETLEIREIPATTDISGRLGIPVGAPVIQRSRTHGVVRDGERLPVMLSATWIPLDVVERAPALRLPDTGPGGMTSRLQEAGWTLGWEDVVTARPAEARERARLGLAEAGWVLVAWRRAFAAGGTGRPLEATVRIMHPAHHELLYRYS
jgi:GntR family transcriptional regulator